MHTDQVRPPLAGWIGGKSRLAKQILEHAPEHTCYVEPFAGAAWVLFRKKTSKSEILNDINSEVVNLYRCVQHHCDAVVQCAQDLLVSREEFMRLRQTPPELLTDVQRAVRFYYLQQCGFNGRVVGSTFRVGTTGRAKFNANRMHSHLAPARERLRQVYLECRPFQEIFKAYDRPDTWFFVDPPYHGVEGYYGKDIFARSDFEELRDILAGLQGKFLLTINDVPQIRDIFAEFNLVQVETVYSVSSRPKRAVELFVKNY